jgi:hypothetical protein
MSGLQVQPLALEFERARGRAAGLARWARFRSTPASRSNAVGIVPPRQHSVSIGGLQPGRSRCAREARKQAEVSRPDRVTRHPANRQVGYHHDQATGAYGATEADGLAAGEMNAREDRRPPYAITAAQVARYRQMMRDRFARLR